MYDYDFFPFCGMQYGLGWVFMILFWVLVIAGVIAIARGLFAGASRREHDMPLAENKTPADVLRERYARGEIERDEYLQRFDDLNRR